jgi:acyl-CoA reductase-like NAD-dependent aldehyde dehydrogenase
MPSNSPGVHGLWPPAVALKTPVVLKPGREEPWTPLRIMQALVAAGCPPEACGFYPTDHAGAGEILRLAGRSMLFGDVSTTQPYQGDPRVQLHGPGWSKVLIGDDAADRWPEFVELIVSSIAANGGRSCLNASAVWTPRHGREIAEAVAKELAKIEALPAEDENARLCAFANLKAAEFFAGAIERDLKTAGAEDVTAGFRDCERLVRLDECAYVLPTLVRCDSPDHPLANREFLLPYAAVVECPQAQMLARVGPTLVCTALTADERLIEALAASRDIDRLNIGPIPTWRIQWDQPHEGNLFEHLYTRRALQRARL